MLPRLGTRLKVFRVVSIAQDSLYGYTSNPLQPAFGFFLSVWILAKLLPALFHFLLLEALSFDCPERMSQDPRADEDRWNAFWASELNKESEKATKAPSFWHPDEKGFSALSRLVASAMKRVGSVWPDLCAEADRS